MAHGGLDSLPRLLDVTHCLAKAVLRARIELPCPSYFMDQMMVAHAGVGVLAPRAIIHAFIIPSHANRLPGGFNFGEIGLGRTPQFNRS